MGAPPWTPSPGNQTRAYESPADVTLYGGAAGGGKTDLLLGLALTRHRRSIVFRRHYTELIAIVERSRELVGSRGRYNGTEKLWRLDDGRRLEFGAVNNPGDERKFQGRSHDLKAFDELAHFTEHQFRYLCGWLRTTEKDQRCRVVATTNPPTGSDGAWILEYWAPWLDAKHPNPARPGELRWFAVLGGKDVEVDGPKPIQRGAETIRPRSRTFIPARVADNPHFAGTDYEATLQALPEPLRAMLLDGDFSAGAEDDPWQVVPTAWVAAAQARWRHAEGPEGPLDTLGVDVARGGRDRTVITPRHGAWFGEQKVYPGSATPDGGAVAGQVMAHLVDNPVVNIDVIGVGASPYDILKERIVTVALNGAAASRVRDRTKKFGFVNKRAEWWWWLREALEPDRGEGLMLPPDRELLADLCAPKWKLTARGIQVESKPEIAARIGRSPDKGDSLVYALAEERVHAPRIRLL